MKPVRLFIICFLAVMVIAVAWKTARTRAFHQTSQRIATQQAAFAANSSPPPPANVLQPSAPQSSPAGASTPPAASDEKETVERLGPFSLLGNNYTVVLHKKHLAASADGEVGAADGVAAMEVVDADGAVEYQRAYPLWADAEAVSAWTVSAYILKGTSDTGLLTRSRPSESSGFYEQIFGVVNGKLVPFCGPFPEMDMKPDSSGEYRTAGPLGPQADEIPVAIGTGRFVMVVPIRIDWALGKLSLAPRCLEAVAGAAHSICEYQLLDPSSLLHKPKSLTFVRLYAQPDENTGKPERIVVKPDSKIEMLASSAEMELKQPDFLDPPLPGQFPMKDMAQIGAAPNTDTWLQVRIEGKVGWIHSDEDFTALGLPEPQDEIN
jgi:hypothetical protein